MKNSLFVLLLYLVFIISYSQDIQDINLGDWMCCNLHSALVSISNKHNIKFKYDIERFKEIKYNDHPFNLPLSKFLDQVCKDYELKYYISSEDTAIHIVDRWYMPENVLLKEKKDHTVNPTRFNFSLSGKIIDKETREALPFVTIRLKGTATGAMSNSDGFFTLLNVPTDTSTIVFSYIGYQTKEIFLTPEIETKGLFIGMESEVIGLEEVVIMTDKQDILQVSSIQAGMIKMSPGKLNALPNLGEKDILRSFQLMPGISAANENSSGLYVRGGTPDQVLVSYDGFTVYNVEHMFGFFSAFNSNSIKDVQLYKGGFDAKYGGRLSSVVEITGKEGNQKEFDGAIDISMMSANGFVEFPIGEKGSMIIAGRRSWKSPVYNKIFDQFSDENETPVGPGWGRPGGVSTQQETKSFFYDLNSKITFRPSDKDVLAISFYNGKDNLDNSIVPQSRTRPDGTPITRNIETIDLTQWGNTGTSLKWSRQFTNRLYLNTLISYSTYFSLRDRTTSGSIIRPESTTYISRGLNEDNKLRDLSGKIDLEYKFSDANQLEFGVQASHNQIDYSYIQNDTIDVISRSGEGGIYSGYLQDKISVFKSKLKITPGLRYSYFTGTRKNYYEPRLNMMYQLSERIRLKGAAGNYYQFAKRVIREDITAGSRDFWVLSDDESLPVSSSWQYIAGLAYEMPKYLFDIEGFYKDVENVTEYSLRIEQEGRYINYSENFFTGTGIAKGIDFLAQKKSGNITGWLGYTISRVTNNIPEFGDYDFYASHDVTHEFKSVMTYKWRKFDFGATWIYATGRPYTAPEGGYQLTLLDGSTADYINVSVKNGYRLPDYHRLDLSATLNFTLGESAPASLGFSIFNLYNRGNVWYKEYEIIDNEIIETPVYYLGITPNINFTINFK